MNENVSSRMDDLFEGSSGLTQRADDEYRGLQWFRNLRWKDPRRGKGRRGDLRVIYYYIRNGEVIFSQGDQTDSVFYIQRGEIKETVVARRV